MALTRQALDKMTASLKRREDSARDHVLQTIERLDLSTHLAELDSQGYTMLPGILSEETVARANEAILQRVEELTGKRIDIQSATEADFANLSYLPYLIYEDDVFVEILLEEKPLALMTYLLGESCLLSSLGSHFKGPGEDGAVPLHSDNGNGMVTPFPTYSQVANINYALTPYSREAGALAVVPGSHHWARQPLPNEMVLGGELTNSQAVAMNLNPGDAVIWHGNTWHGSFPREIPGIRVNLAVYMCRQYIVSQEQHKGVVPEGLLQRFNNNDRLRTLLGDQQPYGWQKEGPDYAVMAKAPKSRFD